MSKQKNNVSVKDIMQKDVQTINQDTKISQAAEMMLEKNIHHLPVVSGSKLIGIFSHTDLMRVDFSDSFGQDQRQSFATLDSSKSILDICSKEVVTVAEKDKAIDAAKAFSEGKFHALPVVDDEKNLLGIVSSVDLIKFYAEL